jgi:hypothetical protein
MFFHVPFSLARLSMVPVSYIEENFEMLHYSVFTCHEMEP